MNLHDLTLGAAAGFLAVTAWHVLALVGIARDPRARAIAGWRW